jgi:hypothetical protein
MRLHTLRRMKVEVMCIAFIEVFANVVDEAKWLYTTWCGCLRGDGIWYMKF